MSRPPNRLVQKKNRTEERLRATPFKDVETLDSEEKAIRLAVWRRFTEAQVCHELLTKPENAFIAEEWRAGLTAFRESRPKEQVFRIFSEGVGLRLELNAEFTKSLGEHESRFFEGVVRAGIEGFGALYLRAKSLLPDLATDGETMTGATVKKKAAT